jgi:ABC-type transport system involved in cytochrome c biogenesis permease subunit
MIILSISFACYLFAVWKRPLIYAGIILQIAYIVSRGAELGRLPLVGPHDTLVFLTASIAAFAVPFGLALKGRDRLFISTAVMAAAFTAFAMTTKQHNTPLPPVLKTFWFECHVVLAFMSYALFGVAALLSGLYLKERDSTLDGLAYRAVLVGYCLFTLSMIFGGIWAYLAWGTYFSFYLHARLRQRWTGRPMAYLGIIGFAVVMFTYLGVSLLMKSSHSF